MLEKYSTTDNSSTSVLLAIEDVTERRTLAREKDELLRRKDFLLKEMNHRINNSLQISGAFFCLKHRRSSLKTRAGTCEMRMNGSWRWRRSRSKLHPTPFGAAIEVKDYLTPLCETWPVDDIGRPAGFPQGRSRRGVHDIRASSQHGPDRHRAGYQFAEARLPGNAKGEIVVHFESSPGGWRLAISDNLRRRML